MVSGSALWSYYAMKMEPQGVGLKFYKETQDLALFCSLHWMVTKQEDILCSEEDLMRNHNHAGTLILNSASRPEK